MMPPDIERPLRPVSDEDWNELLDEHDLLDPPPSGELVARWCATCRGFRWFKAGWWPEGAAP
jgi:hypothetical protein